MGDERAAHGGPAPMTGPGRGAGTPPDPRPVTWRMRLGRFLLGLGGWRAVGRMPDVPQCVALGAPHTSNWDFVLMLPLALAIDARITWMGKDSLFRWPLGWLMRRLGGFPVQRGARLNAVEQAIQRFREREHLVLVMSPEGTRRRTESWKSGFYHIARGAGVPVVLGFLDYGRKEAGIGPAVTLTGDPDADLRTIAAFYADKRGRYPEKETPIRLARAVMLAAAVILPWAGAAAQGTPQGQRAAAIPVADVLVTNARIYTVDETRPRAEAMAIKDGRVLFVGPARLAAAHRGPATRIVDAGGMTVIPGMTDAHGHVTGLGESLRNVDLVGTSSYDEVIARVAARARTTPKGQWIVGRGWDQNDWPDTRFPAHDALSRAVPDHPVALARVDGHALLANAAAMSAAGIGRGTPDPEGGRLERGDGGTPTGVFVDRAMGLVAGRIPPPTDADIREAILAAVRELHRWGLTGVHDAGAPPEVLAAYEGLAAAKAFDLRVYAMIADDSAALVRWFRRGPLVGAGDGRLWVRSVKLYGDGALGSRGAALLEPYSDDPHNRGLVISEAAHVRRVAEGALRAGFQVNTHAIGDRANRNVLDAYEQALGAVPTPDHRFRIEHAQVVHPADLPRFAALGVIPSMQASHQTSDMYWAEQRLGGTRVLGAYAWRTLLDGGSIIPNGSDFPVEAVNPLLSFHAAVARQDAQDWPAGGWHPEQRMTREEALRAMTLWPAMAAFQERELGSLSPGKRADFVVLDRDIMTVPVADILRARVRQTWVGGTLAFEAK